MPERLMLVKPQPRQNTNTKYRHSIAGTTVTCMKSLAVSYITPGSMSLFNCENYQRGRVSRAAGTRTTYRTPHPITSFNSWCMTSLAQPNQKKINHLE